MDLSSKHQEESEHYLSPTKAHGWFHSIFSLLNLGWQPKDNYGNNKAEGFSKRVYGFDLYDA